MKAASTLQQIEAKMARYAGKSEKSTKSGKVFRTIKIMWQRHRIIKEISKLTKQLDDAVNIFNVRHEFTGLPNISTEFSAMTLYSRRKH